MSRSERIVEKWGLIQAGVVVGEALQLRSEFETASAKLLEGDPNPAIRVINKVLDVFGGTEVQLPAWFHALGTAKRNALKFLYKEGRSLGGMLPHLRDKPDMAKYYHMEFTRWGKKLRTLEIASQTGAEETLIKQDGFTIIPIPGLAKKEVAAVLEALGEAASKIRAKFPQVLYGDVYLSTHISAKVAAQYDSVKDQVAISVRARKRFSDIYTLIHEFGHRYDYKFLKDSALRKEFWDLSTRKVVETINYDEKLRREVAEGFLDYVKLRQAGKPLPILSDVMMHWVEARYTPGGDVKKVNMEYLGGKLSDEKYVEKIMGHEDFKIPTGKVLHGPLAVTPYGATKPSENFAEAFAHYVLGMAMPAELQAIFDKL